MESSKYILKTNNGYTGQSQYPPPAPPFSQNGKEATRTQTSKSQYYNRRPETKPFNIVSDLADAAQTLRRTTPKESRGIRTGAKATSEQVTPFTKIKPTSTWSPQNAPPPTPPPNSNRFSPNQAASPVFNYVPGTKRFNNAADLDTNKAIRNTTPMASRSVQTGRVQSGIQKGFFNDRKSVSEPATPIHKIKQKSTWPPHNDSPPPPPKYQSSLPNQGGKWQVSDATDFVDELRTPSRITPAASHDVRNGKFQSDNVQGPVKVTTGYLSGRKAFSEPATPIHKIKQKPTWPPDNSPPSSPPISRGLTPKPEKYLQNSNHVTKTPPNNIASDFATALKTLSRQNITPGPSRDVQTDRKDTGERGSLIHKIKQNSTWSPDNDSSSPPKHMSSAPKLEPNMVVSNHAAETPPNDFSTDFADALKSLSRRNTLSKESRGARTNKVPNDNIQGSMQNTKGRFNESKANTEQITSIPKTKPKSRRSSTNAPPPPPPPPNSQSYALYQDTNSQMFNRTMETKLLNNATDLADVDMTRNVRKTSRESRGDRTDKVVSDYGQQRPVVTKGFFRDSKANTEQITSTPKTKPKSRRSSTNAPPPPPPPLPNSQSYDPYKDKISQVYNHNHRPETKPFNNVTDLDVRNTIPRESRRFRTDKVQSNNAKAPIATTGFFKDDETYSEQPTLSRNGKSNSRGSRNNAPPPPPPLPVPTSLNFEPKQERNKTVSNHAPETKTFNIVADLADAVKTLRLRKTTPRVSCGTVGRVLPD